MTTEIERLWESSQQDPKEQHMNGTLLEQSTFICTNCGNVKPSPAACVLCGDEGELDA